MGLKPGNPDGTFFQAVPLVGFQAKQVTGSFQAGTKTVGSHVSERLRRGLEAHGRGSEAFGDSDVVFVGYGVVAPEFGWDDYKGLDVRGKTLIMLVNDPAVATANDPTKLDPAAFRGPAMTYYGRWTYKYEIASEKGAAAAILVHETGPAGYPFEVVKGSWSRENFDIAQPAGEPGALAGGGRGVDHAREGQRAFPGLRPRFSGAQASGGQARLSAGAAGLQRQVLDHERAPRGEVAERGRQARGL